MKILSEIPNYMASDDIVSAHVIPNSAVVIYCDKPTVLPWSAAQHKQVDIISPGKVEYFTYCSFIARTNTMISSRNISQLVHYKPQQ